MVAEIIALAVALCLVIIATAIAKSIVEVLTN